MLQDRKILLIIGGGIAAYKALELVRLLKGAGAHVRAILSGGGARFITPLSVSSLTGEKVYTDLFSLTDESEMGHIRLSREADLVVVAPATANMMAKMAGGIADDLATTTLLATDKPVMICPAMNVEMWAKPSTARNIARLDEDGLLRVGPEAGDLACGETGPGRMSEPAHILSAIELFFDAANKPLSGLKALVTAGPTFEAIDPVRYIANKSSGKQGYAISEALFALGADTVLISGPSELAAPKGPHFIAVKTALEMNEACNDALPVDVAVCVAAVTDWRVKSLSGQKIKKKQGQPPHLELEENPDILKAISNAGNERPQLVIGFAAETENIIANAQAKLKSKGCDWIVANDVSEDGGVMGGDENTVSLISRDHVESWPKQNKRMVANRLAQKIAASIGREI
jgi:phosphopantothenoylcysteine decarboxylase / phosphopantothenate---cysteine ligase